MTIRIKGFWVRIILALLITVGAAIYQRLTGPTHPTSGMVSLQNTQVYYKFDRGHGEPTDQPVILTAPDSAISGVLLFRRFGANEGWKGMKLVRKDKDLIGALPKQPPAGKMEFFVLLEKNGISKPVPVDRTVITRFTGEVPDFVLILHIFVIFTAMLLSNLAGLEAVANGEKAYKTGLWAAVFLFAGGMILGPVVQKYAFFSNV